MSVANCVIHSLDCMQDGGTALIYAVRNANFQMVKLLLSHNADVNAQDQVTAVKRGSKGYIRRLSKYQVRLSLLSLPNAIDKAYVRRLNHFCFVDPCQMES